MPHHLLPSLRQALAEDRPHALLTLAVAAWFRYLRGVDAEGRPVVVDDPRADDAAVAGPRRRHRPAPAARRPVDLRRPGRATRRSSPSWPTRWTGWTATASGLTAGRLAAPVRAVPRRDRPDPTPRETHRMPPVPTQLARAGAASCSATPTATSSPPRSRPSTRRSRSPTPSSPRSAATAGSPPTSSGSPPPGMNFRTTARRLAAEAGVPDVDVEPWVAEEKRAVTRAPRPAPCGRTRRRPPR